MNTIIGSKTAEAPAQVVQLQVTADDAGQRLDNFLMRQLKGVPKTHVYRIIRSGEVRLNKARASAQTRLAAGDQVRLPPVRQSQRAQDKAQAQREGAAGGLTLRQFSVVYEDEHVLVVDKPAGVAVHGGSGVSYGVIEQLRMTRPQAPFLELVHRLDRETSGLLLVAKKRSALTALQDQFRQRQTGKTYYALTKGQWPASLKVLDQPLHKYLLPGSGERRVKVVSRDDPDGMPALTLVRVVSANAAFSLLQVRIKTGRTHQIRVHLAHAGHPIAGDDKYGDFALNRALAALPQNPLRRMFLHAGRLAFDHPASGARIDLYAPLPPELARAAITPAIPEPLP
ncbi:MAG: RluA family pseudouridine synthase [Rhodoferax sp.]